jgi:hypothetical protein
MREGVRLGDFWRPEIRASGRKSGLQSLVAILLCPGFSGRRRPVRFGAAGFAHSGGKPLVARERGREGSLDPNDLHFATGKADIGGATCRCRKTPRADPLTGRDYRVSNGIVTCVGFTCQKREALTTRMSKFQCLRDLVAQPNRLENRLFLANVTMPLQLISVVITDGYG